MHGVDPALVNIGLWTAARVGRAVDEPQLIACECGEATRGGLIVTFL
jgi:hypothetical protein